AGKEDHVFAARPACGAGGPAVDARGNDGVPYHAVHGCFAVGDRLPVSRLPEVAFQVARGFVRSGDRSFGHFSSSVGRFAAGRYPNIAVESATPVKFRSPPPIRRM